jgi:hypothetical protein
MFQSLFKRSRRWFVPDLNSTYPESSPSRARRAR